MLDKTISRTMHTLVHQHRDDFYTEESKKRQRLCKEEASRGWSVPQGSLYQGLFEIRKESIKKMPDIIWNAAIEALDAYKPSYYPEIADDLKQELNIYFPKSLAEPDNSLQRSGWPDPECRNKENERSQLEGIRHSALSRLYTKIDLFVARITPKEGDTMQEKPVHININGPISNSPIAINNSANSNQISVRINDISPLINAIKDALNNFSDITEEERKSHLMNAENLEKELAKPTQDKNFILKSLDSLANAANSVGTIASSVESLRHLLGFLS